MKTIQYIRTTLLVTTLFFAAKLQANEIGLNIGDKAAAFELTNQNGTKTSLTELTAEHDKLALVFFRSADWCPHCKRQLVGLQNDLEIIEQAGVRVVGISYDSVEVLDRFSKENNISYTLLSDPGSKTIDAYKIRNESVRPGRAEGIPHPTIFMVNNQGVIEAKLREESIRNRPTTEEIVTAANAMDSEV